MSIQTRNTTATAQRGCESTTWTPPPLFSDRQFTIPELYAFHAEKSPNHPVMAFDEENDSVQSLTYKEVFTGIRKAAKIVSGYVSSVSPDDAAQTPVVSILAVADSPSYLTLVVGTMYAGLTPFPLSTRNPVAAVAHLVRKMNVHALLVSRDAAMQRTAQGAKRELAGEGYELALFPMPEFKDLYNSDEAPNVQMGQIGCDKPGLILHSSGSTSYPKPITISHKNVARWATWPSYGDLDPYGRRVSMHGLPMFHLMGAFSIAYTVGTGMIVTFFRPSSSPIVPTPDFLLEAAVKSQCDSMFCVPAFLEAWAQNPQALSVLKRFDVILHGGAPLNKQVGDSLREQGVKIVTGYGVTEAGAPVKVFIDPNTIAPQDWQYFTLSPHVNQVRLYQDGQPGIFELVIADSPLYEPNVYNTIVDGRPAYATSDLMEEHPADPAWMRVYGRADDQIILSTGEKTNPVPMEAILLQDPSVDAALMFGRGQFQNGVIVQPRTPFDPADEAQFQAFRNGIWPTVERANKLAPSHSRIFKEMIIVTKPSKAFQYTAKGTPRRHVSIAAYDEEIRELYLRKVEESSQVDVAPPTDWNASAVQAYVRALVRRVLNTANIEDHDNVFQYGADSSQATWIRNTILHALRMTTEVSVHELPVNFVYANPTISTLSAFLIRTLSGAAVDKGAERTAQLAEMNQLLEKYGSKFSATRWEAASSATDSETVLITGTTGRLGSHLLSQLLRDPKVKHVYALNRGTQGPSGLAQKQREAFRMWGLDPELLDSRRVSFHAADLAKPDFALGKDVFEELQRSVTSIIHNAWRVDFNVALKSFEPLLAGARNLIDFALASSVSGGPRVLFVSSISALINHPSSAPVAESLEFGPELAVGLGYGESKWIAEQMLGRAARESGLQTTVVRAGQLCGDSRVGGWNVKEWVPAMVRASKMLGCVPAKEDTIAWIPVDKAAAAILEMLQSNEQVLSLTASRPVTWMEIFQPVAEILGVPLVSVSEWMEKLRESARRAEDGKGHESAHNLIEFFEATLSAKETPFTTENAVRASRSLAVLKPLGKEDVLRWLSFWESAGFLALGVTSPGQVPF